MSVSEKLYINKKDIRDTFSRFKEYQKDEFTDSEERDYIFNKLKSVYINLDKNDERYKGINENSASEIDDSWIQSENVDFLNSLIKWNLFFEKLLYFIIFLAIASVVVFVILNFSYNNKFLWDNNPYVWNTFMILFPSLIVTGLINSSLIFTRYGKYTERYIVKGDPEKISKRSISLVGYLMTTSLIRRYENNVTGLVYLGAGFLVIIVGLRGIGDQLVNKLGLPFHPSILGERGGVANWLIFFALAVEFSLLIALALFTFFKDEAEVESGSGTATRSSGKDGEKVPEAINVNVMNLDLLERFFMANSSAIDSLRDSFDKWTKDRVWKNNLQSIDDKITGIMDDNSLDSGFMSVNSKLEESNRSLEDINGKLDLNYTKEVFRELIDQLNKVEPKNVVEISAAFGKIQTAVNEVSTKIKDEELNSKIEAFNNSIKEIKKTLGVALTESGNGTKPIINQ